MHWSGISYAHTHYMDINMYVEKKTWLEPIQALTH